MLRKNNPYSPGAGRKPIALVGRDLQIEIWESELERIENGLDSRPMAFYGLRGVGKTVLLSRLHEIAQNKNWISARFEAFQEKNIREMISYEFESTLTDLARPNAGKKILSALKTALSFRSSIGLPGGFSFGIDLSDVSGSNANTNNISNDLLRFAKDLSDVAADTGTGVSILIDEAQDLSMTDLAAISELAHRATQDGLRLVIALAGLPTLPGLLSKSKSYAERLYDYHSIEKLSLQDASCALTEPAKKQAVLWQKNAADKVIEISDGYPYFLQAYGSAVWLEAKSSPILIKDVDRAMKVAQAQLDSGFFLSRWDRISDAQKDYLQAMAEDENGESFTGDIASRLHTSTSSLSPKRSELIRKGLIYSPRKGVVAFTVPLMADFINRHAK